jgi:hypothetical protein
LRQETPAAHRAGGVGRRLRVVEQIDRREFAKAQLDQISIGRNAEISGQCVGDRLAGARAVCEIPESCGDAIQAVRAVRVEVVDEEVTSHGLDSDSIAADRRTAWHWEA